MIILVGSTFGGGDDSDVRVLAVEDAGLDATGRGELGTAAENLDGLEFGDVGSEGGLEFTLFLDFLLDLGG